MSLAALSAKEGTLPRKVDYKKIQKELIDLGASVFRDEAKMKKEKKQG